MEIVVRVAVVYLFIMVALRVLGKREFGELSPLELICLLLVPEIVSQAIQGESHSVTNGFIGIATLFTLVFLTSLFMHRFKTGEEIVAGVPTVLAHRGRLFPAILNRERVTPEELYAEMHKVGLETIEQVRWAILEDSGSITIVPERPEDRDKRGTMPFEGQTTH